ncbi:hypothetical protein SELR_pSRC300650 (plasmid) [Selenomonas ruminantium subsp. lactilytica TAM6421]|uniref:Uncharacterized protein n=1 Tax=Selenomonas ruminantium subsp. lactilytica (strain NBRC 103574 / TAM6421) TaxID=927704 RepID=I0GWK1_SELRL|nr:hypothetical protein [Selenomonas ruminantium]BAL85138.1 hypothetical protein SELR_pSRC300650 [Selenomonas ruminantium subsp. lactilytica TAM6421]
MATGERYYTDKKEILVLKSETAEYEENKDFNPFDPESDDGTPDSFWDGMREYQSHIRKITKELKTDWVDNYTSDGETLDPDAGNEAWEKLMEEIPMLTNGSLVQALEAEEWKKLVKQINRYAWRYVDRLSQIKSNAAYEEDRLGYTRCTEYTPEEFVKEYKPELVDGKIYIKNPKNMTYALRGYVEKHREEIETLINGGE